MPSKNSIFKAKLSKQHNLSGVFSAAGGEKWSKVLEDLASQMQKAADAAQKSGQDPSDAEQKVIQNLIEKLQNTLPKISARPNAFDGWSESQQQKWLSKQQLGFEQIHREIDGLAKHLPPSERQLINLPPFGQALDYKDPFFQQQLSQQMLRLLNNRRVQQDLIEYLRSVHQMKEAAENAAHATESYVNNMQESTIGGLNAQLMHADYTPQGYLGKQFTRLLMDTMFWLASMAKPELAEEIEPTNKNNNKNGMPQLIPMKM